MNVEITSVSRHPPKLLDAGPRQSRSSPRKTSGGPAPRAFRKRCGWLIICKWRRRMRTDWAITARGFNTALGNKLLVMIDGRTVYTPLYSGVFWDVQDYLLEDIDRIEVISGPGGTLWGANAVNGVINIITKSAADTQGLYAEAGGGSEPHEFAGARYGGSLDGDTHFRVYGKYFDAATKCWPMETRNRTLGDKAGRAFESIRDSRRRIDSPSRAITTTGMNTCRPAATPTPAATISWVAGRAFYRMTPT